MKKLVFFVMLAVSVVACKKAATSADTAPAVETTTAATPAPEFGSAAAQEYVDNFNTYFDMYKEAIESKDAAKLQELAARGTALAEAGQKALEGLTGDDAVKLQEYMVQRAQEIAELSKM